MSTYLPGEVGDDGMRSNIRPSDHLLYDSDLGLVPVIETNGRVNTGDYTALGLCFNSYY